MARPALNLRLNQCHDIIFSEFQKFTDWRPVHKYKLTDFLMSTFGIFTFKTPSLLGFEKIFKINDTRAQNLKRLLRLENVPSDTQLRDVMDFVEPAQYRPIFTSLFEYSRRQKLLESFAFMDLESVPYYLVGADGTGFFSSQTLHCDGCQDAEYEDTDDSGNKTRRKHYRHSLLAAAILHPNQQVVIPFCPEVITTQDGHEKNDCEQTAFKRFLIDFKREHPRLNVIFCLDALYATAPVIEELNCRGYRYIISVKNNKHHLHDAVSRGEISGTTQCVSETRIIGEKVKKVQTSTYRFCNQVKLHQDMNGPTVNFIEVDELTVWEGKKGVETKTHYHFTFITDIPVHEGNVKLLTQGGRARWKIENETFNTLKNSGYYLEHNYGHGKYNLATNFIMSTFLAFFVDQIQQMSCQVFKKILVIFETKKLIWTTIVGGLDWTDFMNWDEIYERLLRMKKDKDTG